MANSVWLGPFGMQFNGTSYTFPFPVLLPDGSPTLPALAPSSSPSVGIFFTGGNMAFAAASNGIQWLQAADISRWKSSVTVGWSSGDPSAVGTDASLSRISSGLIGIGTGSQGSFAGGLKLTSLTLASATPLLATSVSLTDGSGAQVATMTNGPTAGNPTKWFAINDNGTTRFVPSW